MCFEMAILSLIVGELSKCYEFRYWVSPYPKCVCLVCVFVASKFEQVDLTGADVVRTSSSSGGLNASLNQVFFSFFIDDFYFNCYGLLTYPALNVPPPPIYRPSDQGFGKPLGFPLTRPAMKPLFLGGGGTLGGDKVDQSS